MKNSAKVLLVVVALLSSVASPAMAEGFYGAIDLGKMHALDVCAGAIGCSSGSNAARISGGYQFAPLWAAEVSYGSYGSATLGPGNGDWKTEGFQVSLVGNVPVGKVFSFIAKVGLADTKLTMSQPGGATLSASRFTMTSGIGAQVNLDTNFALRAQYENLGEVGDAIVGPTRLHLLSIGAVVKF